LRAPRSTSKRDWWHGQYSSCESVAIDRDRTARVRAYLRERDVAVGRAALAGDAQQLRVDADQHRGAFGEPETALGKDRLDRALQQPVARDRLIALIDEPHAGTPAGDHAPPRLCAPARSAGPNRARRTRPAPPATAGRTPAADAVVREGRRSGRTVRLARLAQVVGRVQRDGGRAGGAPRRGTQRRVRAQQAGGAPTRRQRSRRARRRW